MFGFNWIDLIVLLLIAAACYYGLKVGLLTLLFVFAGFFGGLFLAGWLFPHILPLHDRTLRTVANANLVLITAFYIGLRGFDLGRHMHYSLKGKWHYLESALGLIVSITSCLVAVWLIGGALSRLPFVGLSNSANDALIEQKLDHFMPPIPAVMAEFDRQVDPNSAPSVSIKPQPQTDFNYSADQFAQAQTAATSSVVRVTSFGCGGVVSGSGFTVGPGLIATNAHVIAGVKRPIIKYNNRSYEGVPVLFDGNLDFAVLRVDGLRAPALTLAKNDLTADTTVAILGYPNGNFTSVPGIVRDNQTVFGRNIYDEALTGRDVYEVQTMVETGSSGSPAVLANGQVSGMIFSKSDTTPNYGFALASPHLQNDLNHVHQNSRRVSTGVCLAG